jgi:hypothetical protein
MGGGGLSPFSVSITILYSFRSLAKPLLLFSKKTKKNHEAEAEFRYATLFCIGKYQTVSGSISQYPAVSGSIRQYLAVSCRMVGWWGISKIKICTPNDSTCTFLTPIEKAYLCISSVS